MTGRSPSRSPPRSPPRIRSAPASPPAPASAERVLAERAERLARRLQPQDDGRASFSALVFDRAAERYALDMRYVLAVVGTGPITPVPGAPVPLLGVTNLRGEVVAVFDLPRVLAVSAPEPGRDGRLVVLGEHGTEFAVFADAVLGIEMLDEDGLDGAAGTRTSLPAIPLVRGVTESAVVVLDGAALLADARLYLNADPERIT